MKVNIKTEIREFVTFNISNERTLDAHHLPITHHVASIPPGKSPKTLDNFLIRFTES